MAQVVQWIREERRESRVDRRRGEDAEHEVRHHRRQLRHDDYLRILEFLQSLDTELASAAYFAPFWEVSSDEEGIREVVLHHWRAAGKLVREQLPMVTARAEVLGSDVVRAMFVDLNAHTVMVGNEPSSRLELDEAAFLEARASNQSANPFEYSKSVDMSPADRAKNIKESARSVGEEVTTLQRQIRVELGLEDHSESA